MKKYGYLIAGLLIITSCNHQPAGEDELQTGRADGGAVMEIAVAPVVRRDMTDTIRIFGEVALRQEVRLASQFDGRLNGFTLLMGDPVKKGEQLGVIVPPMREALLQVLDKIEPAQRERIAQEIHEIPIYSPLDGVVLEVYKHAGDVISRGEPIVHIGRLSVLEVHGDLPVALLGRVRHLHRIQVEFVDYDHVPLQLPVITVGGAVNAATQTVPLRLRLDNPSGAFRPGMMVHLTFPGDHHPGALVVPREALLEEEGLFSVFVVEEDGTVKKRKIIPGIRQDRYVEVLSGVEEGESVATSKTYSLTDGMEVTVR